MSGRESSCMVRCVSFMHRPSHADQLHMDLWWRGLNVLSDPGTFSYVSFPTSDWGFKSTFFHNTVAIDGLDQMTDASQFLWLDWSQGHERRLDLSEQWDYAELEHDGYRRIGVSHRRTILRVGDHAWVIVDDLLGSGVHSCRLHWLLADFPFDFKESDRTLTLRTPLGSIDLRVFCASTSTSTLARAGQQVHPALMPDREDRGWIAPCYNRLEPGLSFAEESCAQLPIRFITIVGMEDGAILHVAGSGVRIRSGDRVFDVSLAVPGENKVVNDIQVATFS